MSQISALYYYAQFFATVLLLKLFKFMLTFPLLHDFTPKPYSPAPSPTTLRSSPRSAPSSPVASAQSLPQSQSSLQFRRRTPSKIQV
ncbi:hypothetical protein [Acaryochloris sp. CCMEE 5410]|uniref:hypothetical protein n=1 Tax=Acaryochloris sp. CCMEE 5410 TaxID=310037 RepID=UPI0002484F30|nr:hypothetical protein [Acaryochloris sp. CCMEE 5410]